MTAGMSCRSSSVGSKSPKSSMTLSVSASTKRTPSPLTLSVSEALRRRAWGMRFGEITYTEKQRVVEKQRVWKDPKMHAKTDAEVTSLAASSPARSPQRPVYYVQSPSRDSHDGEKTVTSFHSTPVLNPMGSPPHSHASLGHHSHKSSCSRFSGSRKITPNDASRAPHGKSHKSWKQPDVSRVAVVGGKAEMRWFNSVTSIGESDARREKSAEDSVMVKGRPESPSS